LNDCIETLTDRLPLADAEQRLGRQIQKRNDEISIQSNERDGQALNDRVGIGCRRFAGASTR
jgi:hypothetical protein